MVVHTTADDGFGAVADSIADDRGERVVADLEAAMADDGPVVRVGSPSDVTEHELLALQRRLLDRGPEDGAFSVVTGFTPEQAESLYFDRDDHNGEDALLFRTPPTGGTGHIDGSVFAGDEMTVGNVESVTDERLRSFTINAGGRPIHVFLRDGYICGFPRSQSLADYPGPQPFCATDGERDCPVSDNLVDAESIDAAHFFFVSCSSTIDNGTAGLPVHVPLGLLNGADSLLGSYRVTASRPHELLFHQGLLEAGYGLSERAYVLNEHSHRNGICGFPYIGFGRPHTGVDDPHDPAFDVAFDTDGVETTVRFGDVDATVLDVTVPDDAVPAHDDGLFVRNRTDADDRVYYSVFDDHGDTRLFAYTGGRMRFDELELSLGAGRAMETQRRIAVDAARNVHRTAEMGFLNADAEGHADQLHSQLRKLPERTVAEWFDADFHPEVEQHLSTVHGYVDNIREEILTDRRESGDFIQYAFASNVVETDVYPSEQICTICGDRPTFIKQVTGWSGDAHRLLSQCPRCGFVFNIPADGRDPDPAYPLVTGDLRGDDGGPGSIEITFENTGDEPVQATFAPLVLHVDNVDGGLFDPLRRDAVVAPGETHVAEFVANGDRLPDNMYYVLGLVVANLEVHAGFDAQVLGGAAGYYPRHER